MNSLKLISTLLTVTTLLFFSSCEKEAGLNDYDQMVELDVRGQKVDVCHNGKIINVSINAVQAHQNHGDAVDMDGDGYFDGPCNCGNTAVDCDDNNGAVNPGATESLCNGIDDDCDASTTDSSSEICDNGIDDDCDGDIDEYDSDCAVICEPGEVEIFFNGPLFVAPVDEPVKLSWQDAINACAAKSAADGCDWFLPNLDELNALFDARSSIGGFNQSTTAESFYWSSVQGSGGRAWVQSFGTGQQSLRRDILQLRCRCVRR